MNLISIKQNKNLFIFLITILIIRMLVAPTSGLGVDEAHYALYGEILDWSYFDHPPLVGWVEYIFISLFGENEFAIRLPAILIGFFSSIFLYKLLYDFKQDSKIAFLGVLALHGLLIFNILYIIFLPDTLLFLFIIPIIYNTLKVIKTKSTLSWICLGILLGLAGLSKYTAILFIVPIFLYVIIRKEFKLLINYKILYTIIIALIIISPVIYWNMEHNWISFAFQSGHVIGHHHISFYKFAKSLLAQFVAYNPFLMPLSFYGLYIALRSKIDIIFLSGLFGLVLVLFFGYSSFYETALPHWTSPFYMIFIPIGVISLHDRCKKYIKFAIGFGIILSAIIYSEFAFKYIPQPNFKSIQQDIYGWDTIMKKAILLSNNNPICVMHWTRGSRAMYYAKDKKNLVYVLDKKIDQFDLWNDTKTLISKDILIVEEYSSFRNLSKYLKCDTLKNKGILDLKLNGRYVNKIRFTQCINFQGLVN